MTDDLAGLLVNGRKRRRFTDAPHVRASARQWAVIDTLPVFTDDELYAVTDPVITPLRPFERATPSWFVLQLTCGDRILVNTEGYPYARYVGWLTRRTDTEDRER